MTVGDRKRARDGQSQCARAFPAGNQVIRILNLSTSSVSVYAGGVGMSGPLVDGSYAAARFSRPAGLALGASGQLFVVDQVGGWL